MSDVGKVEIFLVCIKYFSPGERCKIMQEISLKVPAKHHGLCIPIFSLPMCAFRAGYKNCRKNFWSRLSASSTHPLTSIHLSRNAARKKCWILLVSYPTFRPLPSERPFNLQRCRKACLAEFVTWSLIRFAWLPFFSFLLSFKGN